MKSKFLKIMALTLLALALASAGLVMFWQLNFYYNATSEAFENPPHAIIEAPFMIQETSGTRLYKPDSPKKVGIIFFQGAGVDAKAYNNIFTRLAQKSYLCVVVKSPLRIALFPKMEFKKITNYYGDKIETWVVGGHSLGGLAAANFATNNIDEVSGVFLLGSYLTKDFSQKHLSTLTIYGENDMVINREKLEQSNAFFPVNSKVVEIKGGNHAYFANYGEQKGDGKATINPKKQQKQTVDEIIDWINETDLK